MYNIKLEIEYDGTNYCGWQKQNGKKSIQGELERVINKITGEKILLHGSGRTDKGVHARGQVANFKTNSTIPGDRFSYVINSNLPYDINIISSSYVDSNFHARYSAIGKKYKYIVLNAKERSPLLRNYSYFVPYKLDIDKIQYSLQEFLGSHDFKSFMADGSNIQSTIRTIDEFTLNEIDNNIIFMIKGNGFLYNMIRIIIGTLIDIGRGKRQEDQIQDIFSKKNRLYAGPTAGAQGLYLEKVYY